eukprot:TRINITY_DN23946_c0_g1_i1.p1 TRINITY_DN23946_c0_g1~~TRINITY_DN23946_c0_g1_i1.p1  ORF type:complete len:395 (+),score=67.50 TRINITY_DN23946_c0_g1_i1:114-1187(+)
MAEACKDSSSEKKRNTCAEEIGNSVSDVAADPSPCASTDNVVAESPREQPPTEDDHAAGTSEAEPVFETGVPAVLPSPVRTPASEQASPTLFVPWPRTMDEDDLEMIAGFASAENNESIFSAANSEVPFALLGSRSEVRSGVPVELSPTASVGDAVTLWPPTMEDGELEMFAGLLSSNAGVAKSATTTVPPASVGAASTPFWPDPRIGDGDLEFMAFVARAHADQSAAMSPYVLDGVVPPLQPPTEWAPTMVSSAVPPPPESQAQGVTVIHLADVLPLAEPGSAEMPTVGSKDHFNGNCKPCAFLHTRGCNNGVNCSFCHLCDENERKRRQKMKKEQKQERRQQPLPEQAQLPHRPR